MVDVQCGLLALLTAVCTAIVVFLSYRAFRHVEGSCCPAHGSCGHHSLSQQDKGYVDGTCMDRCNPLPAGIQWSEGCLLRCVVCCGRLATHHGSERLTAMSLLSAVASTISSSEVTTITSRPATEWEGCPHYSRFDSVHLHAPHQKVN